jgi:hypothetical protein
VRAEPTGSGEGQGLLWENVSELTPVIRDVLQNKPRHFACAGLPFLDSNT